MIIPVINIDNEVISTVLNPLIYTEKNFKYSSRLVCLKGNYICSGGRMAKYKFLKFIFKQISIKNIR